MITIETLQSIPMFKDLDPAILARIECVAGDLRLPASEWLLQEGDVAAFYVVIEGDLEVWKHVGGDNQSITNLHTGNYVGEVELLIGSPMLVSVKASTESRVMKLEGVDFLDLIMGSEQLAVKMIQTMAQSVAAVQKINVANPVQRVTLVGPSADVKSYELRQFLSGNRIAYRTCDPEIPEQVPSDLAAETLTAPFPTVVFCDGTVVNAPSCLEVAERTGLQTLPEHSEYDVVIIGGGPTGLAAAVYGASEGLKTLLLESQAPGGQAGTSSRIENYLGFPTGLSGSDLGVRALEQAKRFGAEVVVARSATEVIPGKVSAEVILDGYIHITARTTIIATGVCWRRLQIPGADELIGKGIYYGAARTEAMGIRGKEIFLIGGGNSAGQAAIFFADYASKVTLLIRADDIGKGMSQYLINQIQSKANIVVCVNSSVVEVSGSKHLEAIVVESRSSIEGNAPVRQRFETSSLFSFIGADAQTDWLPRNIGRDDRGYILTGREAQETELWPLNRDPYLLETTVPGIFAAGDVRHNSIKRVASGVGEGSMCIAFVHQYISTL